MEALADFVINKNGLVLVGEAPLPHVAHTCMPSAEYHFTVRELMSHIDLSGPLAAVFSIR
jgi:hypothetical protein